MTQNSETEVSLKISDNLRYLDMDNVSGVVVEIDHESGDVCIEEPSGLECWETLDTIFDSWIVENVQSEV